jgi:hypothetical protein
LSTSNSDKTLVAVILGLVDFDHTTTKMSDFIDLGTTLTDDSADHVVRNVDLLSDGLVWNNSGKRLSTSMGMGLGLGCSIGSRLLRTRARIWSTRRGAIVKRRLGHRCLSRGTVGIWNAIWARKRSVGLRVVSLERLGVAVLSTSGLGHVWYDLHTTGHNACRSTAARSISRRGGSAETLCQLLHEGDSNIVGCNVHGISNTQNHEGTFCRERETSV